MSGNLVLTSESAKLMEKILNLTSTNSQLTQEVERLERNTTRLEEEKQNMSEAIGRLIGGNAQREEQQQELLKTSLLLKDEILQLKEKNRQLADMNRRYEGEAKETARCENVSQSNAVLQVQNHNLQTTLTTQQQKAKASEELMAAQIRSTREALNSLDLYCPVVSDKTKGACSLFPFR